MKLFSFSILLIISNSVFAQYTFNDPVSARNFNTQKYSGMRGTPFLFDDWIRGVAFTSGKNAYKDIELKVDAYENVLFFSIKGEPFEFRDRIEKFVLMPDPLDSATFLYFRNGFSGVGVTPKQYVQILTEGKIELVKLESKAVTEMSEINAGIIKSFITTTKYFVRKADVLQGIKFNKKELSLLMKDKESMMNEFVEKNSLSFKKEEDVRAMIDHYNQLHN